MLHNDFARALDTDIDYLALIIRLRQTAIKQLTNGVPHRNNKQITALNAEIEAINFQLAKLQVLKKSRYIPIFYTSIQTGKTIYSEPRKEDELPPAQDTATHSSTARSPDILFGYKTPRSPLKLMAKSQLSNTHEHTPALSSIMTLEQPDGTKLATLEIEHKDLPPGKKHKYPYGGISSKVKRARNIKTNDERAIKSYKQHGSQELTLSRARRSKCLSDEILDIPSEVCCHGGQVTFITEWHKEISQEEVDKLTLADRLIYLLQVTYQVALFHQYDLLLMDLKLANFVYTQDGARMIDLDGVIHFKEIDSTKGYIATTNYMDDASLRAFVENRLQQHLKLVSKRFDVYSLGILAAEILPSIRNNILTPRNSPYFRKLVRENPLHEKAFRCVDISKKSDKDDIALNALIDELTNSDYEKRPGSAVEVYERLRQLVLDNGYVSEDNHKLPPKNLPLVTQADSDAVYEKLVQLKTDRETDHLTAIKRCNQDPSFHQNTPDNAVRYDYQTLKNIKFREKTLQLGHADVNKRPLATSYDADTESVATHSYVSTSDSTTKIVVNERPPENNQQRDISLDELKTLNHQFKLFVACIIKHTPNIDSKHSKYSALKKFNEIVQTINTDQPVTADELRRLAKNFFHLSLSHVRFDFFNTTETGLKCRAVLGNEKLTKLRNFLFPERNPDNENNPTRKKTLAKEGVRYRDMRNLVCGNEKNTQFFSHKKTKVNLDNWKLRPLEGRDEVQSLANFQFR